MTTGHLGGPGGKGRFLSQVPLDKALERWFFALQAAGAFGILSSEEVPTGGALGRVLAEPAIARFSSPSYHACAMDGYAVRSADTFGASETSALRLRLPVQAVYADTGDPLPPGGFDAMVMIEDAQEIGEDEIEIRAPATPWPADHQ